MTFISLTLHDLVKTATKVVQKWDITFNIWGAVPSTPPAVLLTPFWKTSKFFSTYAPEGLYQYTQDEVLSLLLFCE